MASALGNTLPCSFPELMKKKNIVNILFAVAGVSVLAAAIFIMCNRIGLNPDYDFGAGAYYYADIPDFDKVLKTDGYEAKLPFWVYMLIFFAWGWVVWLIWKWVEGRNNRF